ncbi:MAG: hypothetical protein FJ010_02415 [Chloroflexi bacterium]|nr:hypothetical protein [Chloroflexota bacterium]
MMGPGLFGCCGGWGSFGSYGWIGMILNLVLTVAVIVGIVWLLIWLVRRVGAGGSPNTNAGGQSPREIVQARYARGEITREQYLALLEDLN